MIKKIISAVKVISLALVLSFGLSYVYAWTAPTVTPPGGNVAAPLNVSSVPQTKAGGLTVGSLATGGATLGPTTSNYGAATLKGDTNGWSGVNFKDSAGSNSGTLMMKPTYSGFFNAADNNWRMYVSDTSATGFGDVVADDYYIASIGRWASGAQTRVAGWCAVGSSIRAIDAAGNVTCQIDHAGSGSDNLGNHTATQTLNMNGQSIIGANTLSLGAWTLFPGSDTWLRLMASNGATYKDLAVGTLYTDGSVSAIGNITSNSGVINNPTFYAYSNSGGGIYTNGPVNATDYYIASTGKWASGAQTRVTGSCTLGQAITAINADGTVSCGNTGAGGYGSYQVGRKTGNIGGCSPSYPFNSLRQSVNPVTSAYSCPSGSSARMTGSATVGACWVLDFYSCF